MKKGLFMIIAATFCCMNFSYAQGNDEESIRKILDTKKQADINRDSTSLFSLFTHDPAFSAIYIGRNYYSAYRWQDVHSEVTAAWKRPRAKSKNTTEFSNLKIKNLGDIAFAEFATTTIDSAKKPVWQSVESWSFVKNDGSWKINKMVSVDTSSFNYTKPLNDGDLEGEINMTGYRLMAVKKYDQAIKIFKMNVELFPKAWNTYDSLGEGYAAMGNNKDAIINYEKSVQLNPDNTNGKTILAKLKKAN